MGRADRVLLVEDNEVYRDSLAFLLARHEGLEVVGAVGTAEAATPWPPSSLPMSPSSITAFPTFDGGEAAAAIRELAGDRDRLPDRVGERGRARGGAQCGRGADPEGRGHRHARGRDAPGGGLAHA